MAAAYRSMIIALNQSAQLSETHDQIQSMVHTPDDPSSSAVALRPSSAPCFLQLTSTPIHRMGQIVLTLLRISSSWVPGTDQPLLPSEPR